MTLPLDYFDQLRLSNNESFERNSNSSILRYQEIRLGHVTSLLPTTSRDNESQQRLIIDIMMYHEAAAFLALVDFNQRNSSIVENLSTLLHDECNLYFTMDLRDSQMGPIQASRQFLHQLSRLKPTGLVGASRSAISINLAILGGVYGVPQMDAESTSVQLDKYPFFGRTIPTNHGDSACLISWLKHLGVKHFGILYVRDAYGTEFFASISRVASQAQIIVKGVSFEHEDMETVHVAAQQLKDTRLRYFCGVVGRENHVEVLERLYQAGLIGNKNHVWYFTDGLTDVLSARYKIRESSNASIALNGTGVISLKLDLNENLQKAIQHVFQNQKMLNYFISRHEAEYDLFSTFDYSKLQPHRSFLSALYYDAAMAMAIAACQANGTFFTADQLDEQLKAVKFHGASGRVAFDQKTGTRKEETVTFQITNLIANPPNQDGYVTFTSRRSVVVPYSTNGTIEVVHPYQYFDGTHVPPEPLPPIRNVELNLMGPGVRITGLVLSAVIIISSIAWLVWTIQNRKKPVVKASQPVFLCMICTGTFLMGSSNILGSLQEPVDKKVLDVACMAIPWLFSIGFVTSISALFSKTWRLNKLYKMSQAYRRVTITAKDVLKPFLILLTMNLAILISWTIVAPQTWNRVAIANMDSFGRSIESYGTCFENDSQYFELFYILQVAVNSSALLIAAYQAFKSRELPPSNFNEAHYIGITLASLVEAIAFSWPLLYLVRDSPSAGFIIRSLLVTIICGSILVPLFVPKYLNRNERPHDVTIKRKVQVRRSVKSHVEDSPALLTSSPEAVAVLRSESHEIH